MQRHRAVINPKFLSLAWYAMLSFVADELTRSQIFKCFPLFISLYYIRVMYTNIYIYLWFFHTSSYSASYFFFFYFFCFFYFFVLTCITPPNNSPSIKSRPAERNEGSPDNNESSILLLLFSPSSSSSRFYRSSIPRPWIDHVSIRPLMLYILPSLALSPFIYFSFSRYSRYIFSDNILAPLWAHHASVQKD